MASAAKRGQPALTPLQTGTPWGVPIYGGANAGYPVWRLPLWSRYDAMLDSKTADLSNVSTSPFAGSIICALFLKRFVTAKQWLHFDIYAWTPSARPGRPEGGECQAARALYALLSARYG